MYLGLYFFINWIALPVLKLSGRRFPIVDLMLNHRLRRWLNNESTMNQRLLFPGFLLAMCYVF